MEFNEFSTVFDTVMTYNGLSELAGKSESRKFYLLMQHMLETAKTMNLTAIKEERGIIARHFADSLFAAQFLPQSAKIIDIGCGAGFPCLPLSICRPDLHILAVDSTEKRIRYVKDTAKLLELENLDACAARAEDLAKTTARESFDAAIARAVAELPVLTELCLPFVRVGGKFLAMKASKATEELEKAQNGISRLGGAVLALHDLLLKEDEGVTFSRAVIEIEKTKGTPPEFPRAFAKILKRPL